MEDKKIDFETPLLSVRRFSDTPGPESVRRPTLGRRASLPYYKPELNSGPVRNPGVVPFVWENKPGEPKNGLVSDSNMPSRRAAVAPRLPPGRIINDSEWKGVRAAVKTGSSVRTRKVVNFVVDNGMEKILERNEDVSDEIDELHAGKDHEKGDVAEIKDVQVIEKEEKKEEEEKAIEHQELPVLVACNGGCEVDENEGMAADEEDAFSDALDTLSQNESVFLNCSVSGISGIPDLAKGNGSCSTEPHIRDFMIGRFLPAAQAMASDSSQCTFRKTVNPSKGTVRTGERIVSGELRRAALVLPQQRSNLVLQHSKKQEVVDNYNTDEEDDDEYDNAGQFLSKGCGLLPNLCLKGNFGRLNPVPGMNFQVRKPTPPRSRTNTKIKSSFHAPLGRPEDNSWEDVYKHILVQGNKQGLEDESKSRSESNGLTFSSDSPTAEGSSPHSRPAGEGTPPFRKEAPAPHFHVGKDYVAIPCLPGSKSSNTDGSDLCEKDNENFWESTSRHSSHLDSASGSPALEKTVYMDSVNIAEARVSKSNSFTTIMDAREIINMSEKDSEAGTESQTMEDRFVVEVDSSQLKVVPQVMVPGLLSTVERLNHKEIGSDDDLKQKDNVKNSLVNSGKDDADPLQSLLPPPLPKSPSESWLSRTLPSVTSKNSTPQTLLAIGCQPRKKNFQILVANQKQETNVKFPKSQVRRIRFAEVLATPPSPRSEI